MLLGGRRGSRVRLVGRRLRGGAGVQSFQTEVLRHQQQGNYYCSTVSATVLSSRCGHTFHLEFSSYVIS